MLAKSSVGPWIVYGTGALASETLAIFAHSGLATIVAGRAESRLRYLSNVFGMPWRAFDLRSDFDHLLDGACGVINLAGPYSVSASPLMQACLRSRIHYIDASNDFRTHSEAWALEELSRQRNVAILPGIGLGTLGSEVLVRELSRRLPQPPLSARVIILPSGSKQKSPGVSASLAEVLRNDAIVVKDGVECPLIGNHRIAGLPAWVGVASGISIATGDIVALQRSVKLEDLSIVAAVDQEPSELRAIFTSTVAAARRPSLHRAPMTDEASRLIKSDAGVRARLMAEVASSDGALARGQLAAGSGTSLSAAAVSAARGAIESQCLVGVHTAFQTVAGCGLDMDLGFGVEFLN